VNIASVTSFDGLDLAYKNETAPSGNVIDFTRDAYAFAVNRVGSGKFNLVKGLRGWSKRFVDLSGIV
jgi:hypothetical protein